MNRLYANRRWIHWGLALVLVANAAAYFGWISQPALKAEPDPAALAELEGEVAERAAAVARLKRVRDQAPQMGPQLEGFARERLWAERTGFSRVAAELEQTASEADVEIGRVTYETVAEKDQPDMMRVEIATSIEGNYSNLLHYLQALERSPHFYLISELKLAGVQSGQVRLEMNLATYFRRGAA